MFDWLNRLLGGTSMAQAEMPELQQMAAQLPPAAPAAPAEPANDTEEFSLVESANQVLGAALSRAQVTRVGLNDSRPLPVSSVKLVKESFGPDGLVSFNHANQSAESAKLLVELNRPVGDYTKASLNAAIQQLVLAIPALRGHLKTAEVKDKAKEAPTAVWKELEPLIADKFSAAEKELLQHYFKPDIDDGCVIVSSDHIHIHKKDGIVDATFWIDDAQKDEKSPISGDQQIIDFMTKEKEAVLARFKEKLAAIQPSPLTPEDLQKIDIDVALKNEGNYRDAATVSFGIRDAEGKLQASELSKLDDKLLDTLFTESLVKATPELPPILSRIADADLVKMIINDRAGTVPGVQEALKHDMFKTSEERYAERHASDDAEHPTLGEVRIIEADGQPRMKDALEISIPLPEAVKTVEALRTDIVQNRNAFMQGLGAGQVVGRAA